MSLTTRCIHCHTVFRITLEQLQAHGGQVRCGRCMQVFNGLNSLVPETAGAPEPAAAPAPQQPPAAPVAEPAPPAAEPAATAEARGDTAAEADTVAEAAAVPAAELPVESTAGADASADPGAEAETDAPHDAPHDARPAATDAVANAPAPAISAAIERPGSMTIADDNPFVDEMPAAEPAKTRRPLLMAATVLLAALLAAQAIYFYRGEIAARNSWARQVLTDACVQAGCAVSLPQNTKAVVIEASDLQVVDPAQPNRIQLTATLRNHASHDVAYPALDLVLTNVNDHTLVRRIFLPVEYLGAGRDTATGISANAELTIRLAMDTGNLGAAGFRLAVLPAPSR